MQQQRTYPPSGPEGERRYEQLPPPQRTTNGFAVASLVLGIVWLWSLGSILALVFGYIGKSQIDASPQTEGGRGMAIAGIVLGWVGVGIFLLVLTLFLLDVFTMPWGPMMRDRG